VQQLTDAFFEFEDEKAAWALLRSNHDTECQRLDQEITKLINQLDQLQKSYKDATTAKDCLQEQVVKLDQGLQDSAIIISHNEKQLKELEEAAVKAEDYFQGQLCKLNQALQESAENSLLLEQQLQKSYKDVVTAKDCLQEQVVKLEQTLQDSAIKIGHNEKQVYSLLLTN
jgi:chromosome segregation ATPase